MKKLRILAVAVFIMAACSLPVFAAEFEDVPATSWYHTYVSDLSDKGIIKGKYPGLFCPQESVTCTEALKMVMEASGVEIRDIAEGEEAGFWGGDILATARAEGIANVPFSDRNRPATREEICTYMVNAKGWQHSSWQESVFIDYATEYDGAGGYRGVNGNILYQKGIVTGSKADKGYIFNANSNVTRAETATLVYRLNHYDPLELRKPVGDAEACVVANPETIGDWQKVMLYMAVNNLTEYTVYYSGDPGMWAGSKGKTIVENACDALGNPDNPWDNDGLYSKYHEYFCYTTGCNAKTAVTNGQFSVTLYLNNETFSAGEIKSLRAAFFEGVESELKKMIAGGKITADMTDEQKASVIYDYVCAKCEYDKAGTAEHRFLGYGALIEGKAVCQGYVALYNAMCKELGIACVGIVGGSTAHPSVADHIWTYANIDGLWRHIDVTYADTSEKEAELGSYKYFCKSDREFTSTHVWKE